MDPGDELLAQLIRQWRRLVARLEQDFGDASNDSAKPHPVDEDLALMLALCVARKVSQSWLLNVAVIWIYNSRFALA